MEGKMKKGMGPGINIPLLKVTPTGYNKSLYEVFYNMKLMAEKCTELEDEEVDLVSVRLPGARATVKIYVVDEMGEKVPIQTREIGFYIDPTDVSQPIRLMISKIREKYGIDELEVRKLRNSKKENFKKALAYRILRKAMEEYRTTGKPQKVREVGVREGGDFTYKVYPKKKGIAERGLLFSSGTWISVVMLYGMKRMRRYLLAHGITSLDGLVHVLVENTGFIVRDLIREKVVEELEAEVMESWDSYSDPEGAKPAFWVEVLNLEIQSGPPRKVYVNRRMERAAEKLRAILGITTPEALRLLLLIGMANTYAMFLLAKHKATEMLLFVKCNREGLLSTVKGMIWRYIFILGRWRAENFIGIPLV